VIYFGTKDDRVHALNTSGSLLWAGFLGNIVNGTTPVVDGGL